MQALQPGHRKLIEPALRGAFADSIDIDAAFLQGRETESRWDYLLGHGVRKIIIGLEPHTANNHEVSTVIAKRRAALDQLREHFQPHSRVVEWFWVASGNVDFTPLDKAHARLNQNGIRFIGKQLVQKWLRDDDGPSSGKGRARGRRRSGRPA
jgi:hypothetical protein